MKVTYKPLLRRVPFGWQGLVIRYVGKKQTDIYNCDDAVFDNKDAALIHAQREIAIYEYEDKQLDEMEVD